MKAAMLCVQERYDNQDDPEDQPVQSLAAPFQQQRRRPVNIPTALTDAILPTNRTGQPSTAPHVHQHTCTAMHGCCC